MKSRTMAKGTRNPESARMGVLGAAAIGIGGMVGVSLLFELVYPGISGRRLRF